VRTLHSGHVDDQAVVARGKTRHAVTTAANGEQHVVLVGELDGCDDISQCSG
jgi:hypothetical protein